MERELDLILQEFDEGNMCLDTLKAKLLLLFDVHQRSELLFALLKWIDYGDKEDRENIVDGFLKDFEANNCG